MAVEIGALRALLSLDSAAFERGARRAQASMSNLQRSLARASAQIGRAGRAMTARMTAPVVGAAGLLVRSSLQTIDAQAKMAESMGTTTASLQVLARAADTAGISQSDLEGSMRRMTRRVSLAAQGTGAGAKAFERLGLAFEDMNALDAAERVALIQKRISELIPEAEQAGVASQIFGDKTGLAMLRLQPGTIAAAADELERFGVTVTDIEADKIEEANDAITAIGLVTRGLGNQLAVALAPTLQAIAERIADLGEWFNDLSPEMQRFTGVAVSVAAAVGPLAIALGFVAAGLAAMASPVGLIIVGLGSLAAAAAYVASNWSALVEKYPALQTALDTVGAVAKRVWEIFSETGKAAFDIARGYIRVFAAVLNGDFAGALDAAKGIATRFVDYIKTTFPNVVSAVRDAIANTAAAGREIVTNIASGIRANLAAIGTAIEDLIADIIQWVLQIPARIKESAKAAGRSIIDGIVEGITDRGDTVGSASRKAARDAITAAEDEAQIRSPSREFMRIGEQMMAGLGVGISDRAQFAAQSAADAARQVVAGAGAMLEQGTSRLSGFFDDIGASVAGAIVQGQSLAENLRGVFQRIASDFISSGISRMLSSLFTGGIGGVGGLGSIFAGLFDTGGMIPGGQVGIVGERGPELVRGPASVTSRADTARMMGQAQQLAVTVTMDPSTAQLGAYVRNEAGQVVAQASPRIVGEAVRQTGRQISRSGSFGAPNA